MKALTFHGKRADGVAAPLTERVVAVDRMAALLQCIDRPSVPRPH